MLFSEEKSWTTTTFEYYWNLGLNRIRFREPVNFTPFEARVGYLTYGGDDYWDNLTSMDLGENSPVLLDSTNNFFEDLELKESRTLFFIEFDFMKFNFPNFVVDINGQAIVKDNIAYLPLHHQVISWASKMNVNVPIRSNNEPLFRFSSVQDLN